MALRSRASSPLVRETGGTLALNLAAVALNFLVVLLLSRLLGADGYGAYAAAFAWATVLCAVAELGLTPLVVRSVTVYEGTQSWGLLRGLLRRANQAVLLASLASAGAGAFAAWIIYHDSPDVLHPVWISLGLVPLIALTTLSRAAMQGLRRVVLGRIPETVEYLVFLVLAASVGHLYGGFSATWAAFLLVCAGLASFGLGVFFLRRSLPAPVRISERAYDSRVWLRSGAPLVLLSLVLAGGGQLGTILLSVLATPADAGVFNVASRITTLISFIMLAASYPLMPAVARLHVTADAEAMQRVVVRGARGVLVFAVPTAVMLVVTGSTVLSFFGSGFEGGETAIRIMAIGEVVTVLTGYGGVVLVMTGHERDFTRSVVFGTLANLVLSAALIPAFGINGAAVATATGVAATNVYATWLAWQRLRVWTSVLPLRPSRPRARGGRR